MTTCPTPVNLTDVARVDPKHLALAMQYMVRTGRGLTMLRGITEAELRQVDQALWDELSSNPAERVAVLVRFRCLLGPAVCVAARMRINADLGFNPGKFERALIKQLERIDSGPALAA